MGVESPAAPKASGLSTVADVVVSPKDAFERLREAPTWGWAFLIAFALAIVGAVLAAPATHHATLAYLLQQIATNPLFAGMPDTAKQQMLANAQHPPLYQEIIGWVTVGVTLLIAALLNAAILLVGSVIGRGQTDFKRLWCGSMNVAVPSFGLMQLVVGIIATVRGPDAFGSLQDIMRAAPGLGLLVPHASGALASLLASCNIFMIWGLLLNVTMMLVLARTSKVIAWAFPIIIFVGYAVMQSGLAGALHM